MSIAMRDDHDGAEEESRGSPSSLSSLPGSCPGDTRGDTQGILGVILRGYSGVILLWYPFVLQRLLCEITTF
jgi:hypothetical protein